MFDDEGFEAWLEERTELSEPGVALIRRVRGSVASRNVGGGRTNVSGRYPSQKMGWAIAFESRTVELPAIYQMEHDPDVLAFYEQPEPIRLRYRTPSGRTAGVTHTPDFLVLRRDGVSWEEWKTEGHLVELAERMPARYQRQPDGWRCPPGEAYGAPLGIGYALRSDEEIGRVFVANLAFLEDYLREPPTVADRPEVRAALREIARGEPAISVADLVEAALRHLRVGDPEPDPRPVPGARGVIA